MLTEIYSKLANQELALLEQLVLQLAYLNSKLARQLGRSLFFDSKLTNNVATKCIKLFVFFYLFSSTLANPCWQFHSANQVDAKQHITGTEIISNAINFFKLHHFPDCGRQGLASPLQAFDHAMHFLSADVLTKVICMSLILVTLSDPLASFRQQTIMQPGLIRTVISNVYTINYIRVLMSETFSRMVCCYFWLLVIFKCVLFLSLFPFF